MKKDPNLFLEPPTLLNASTSMLQIRQLNNLTIFCLVQGDPKPNIHWTFINGSIMDHSKIHITSSENNRTFFVESRLQLNHVTYELHHGSYKCIATNPYGNITETIEVKVLGLSLI